MTEPQQGGGVNGGGARVGGGIGQTLWHNLLRITNGRGPCFWHHSATDSLSAARSTARKVQR